MAAAGGDSSTKARCVLGMPIRSGANLLGVLELRSATQRPHDRDLLATVHSIASQLALFLDRSHAEEELRGAAAASRKLLERVQLHMERMPLAYIMGDDSFRVVEWNPASEHIFGWTAAQAIGRDAFDLVVPPELRGNIRKMVHELRQQPESSVTSRNENVTRDGRRIVCDWINTPLFDDAGRFAGFVAMAQDVTDQVRMEEGLRASEERYRSIVEATSEGVWTGDGNGRTTFANAQLAEMLRCSGAPSSTSSRRRIVNSGAPVLLRSCVAKLLGTTSGCNGQTVVSCGPRSPRRRSPMTPGPREKR